jgi:hypothetical protein
VPIVEHSLKVLLLMTVCLGVAGAASGFELLRYSIMGGIPLVLVVPSIQFMMP